MSENPLEKRAFIDPTRVDSYPSGPLTNYSVVSSYQIFESLTFWNKLDFLDHAMSKALLQEIHEKSQSKQVVALALHRMYKLTE